MRTKNIYCVLDTETFGGASNPKGIYNLSGIIHDRQGTVIATFNYLIAEHYDEIEKDDYAKKNFSRYQQMIENGEITTVPTEEEAIEIVNSLCNYYDVDYMTAFNSGFDYTKTKCRELLNDREFIDIYLMACQTIGSVKKYKKFCLENNLMSSSGKSVSTNAQSFYAYLNDNPNYEEEHIALADSKIELEIFKACINSHKAFTKNCHFYDYKGKWGLEPFKKK